MNTTTDQQLKTAIVDAAHSGLESALMLLKVRNDGSFDGAIAALESFIGSEAERINCKR